MAKFLHQLNNALLGPAGKPPPAALDTIQRITDRLTQSSLITDRRAAVLSLKGLSRDWKAEVGQHSLDALLAVLQINAKEDPDIGKATLETLVILCDADANDPETLRQHSASSKDDLGLKHTDVFLSTSEPTHTLLYLLTRTEFYIRFTAVQLLAILLQNRPQQLQQHFLTDADGPSSILAIITEKRDIIRNEALLLTQQLIANNIDIQKALAFESIFENLLSIITKEGGIEGGIPAQDCLIIVDGLLENNPSNQSYFRELSLPSTLPSIMLYPSPVPTPDQSTPQEFSLQFWDTQKITNATVAISIMGTLSKGKGASQRSLEQSGMTRCLIDLALSSNAPTMLKTQALAALSPNTSFSQFISAYIPVPDTNGEEWDRLPEEPALSALVGLALDGEYGGVLIGVPGSTPKEADALNLRVAAASLIDNHLSSNQDERLALLRNMEVRSQPPSPTPSDELSPSLRILHVLGEPPSSPLSPSAAQRILFSTILFTSLINGSDKCKIAAMEILPSVSLSGPEPADEDPPQTFIATVAGSVALAFRAKAQLRDQRSAEPVGEAVEWDRIIVSYLSLLSIWCWDNPTGVKEILEEGGVLGAIVEPIMQTSGVDVLVQGLCAFLLGICYEFNRNPGEITRATIHSIIHSRIGLDTFTSRTSRVREDPRFKSVSIESPILFFDSEGYEVPSDAPDARPTIWLNGSFVEFWKSNAYSVQKSVANDPNAVSAARDLDPETEALITSLKSIIRSQALELEKINGALTEAHEQIEQLQSQPPPTEQEAKVAPLTEAANETSNAQIAQLSERIDALEAELAQERSRRQTVEKEQEDLLVLLDELNAKRRSDKTRMLEKGLEVSEDEEEEEEEDEDEDEDEDGEGEGGDKGHED
ncbi:p115 like vesicle tethering protein [Cantharellus anzutake]|uniref:p115 like vesicle tethering protein n=1 Tax=Cantharellus anzutake TaxID=1750568 RepID=UPI001908BF3D|nr:p115 like vesicle tethering protein [Cantharellus anzutake]KAF8342696.1 p115 like vesicle tethering protein [Cantharellus anzutake]